VRRNASTPPGLGSRWRQLSRRQTFGDGLNSFGFNFSGETSGGKTAPHGRIWGWLNPARESPPDGTPTGFEQRAMGHRDNIMPLDDISHLEGDTQKLSKLVTFRLAGNQTKERPASMLSLKTL
jgi:uncharacterized protein (DUF927 family)